MVLVVKHPPPVQEMQETAGLLVASAVAQLKAEGEPAEPGFSL